MNLLKKSLFALSTLLAVGVVTTSEAAFVVAVDLDPDPSVESLHPNLSLGGDTTSVSNSSTTSLAVGMPAHNSIFGGNGSTFGDTYVISYTPGVDLDNFLPTAGSLLGSTTGFGTETASGVVGGESGLYNVYVTLPSATNVNTDGSNFTITGDGAPIFIAGLDLNDGGTGADLDPGSAFVGGANNAWYKLGTVSLTAGETYTVTQTAVTNSFVSQRLAGVMWEAVPEPSSLAILGMTGMLVLRRRRG